MKKYILTASAIAFGAIFLAAPAYAGEDCLGLSIGPGCMEIATINIAAAIRCQLTLTTTSPPTAASIITTTTVIIIATEITTEPFEAPLTSGVTKRYASTIGD
jgi:hypothetical protein